MKIYNLTGSSLTLTVGSMRKQIKNLSVSDVIVATPELIRNQLLPVIQSFEGKGILIVPNDSDLMTFDMPGCRIPDNIITDDKTANKQLNEALKAKAQAEKKPQAKPTKPEAKEPEPKPEVQTEKDKTETSDENKEPETTQETPEIPEGGVRVTRIPGAEPQVEKN